MSCSLLKALIFSKSLNSPIATFVTPSSDFTVSADLVGRTYAVIGHSGCVFFISLIRGAGTVSHTRPDSREQDRTHHQRIQWHRR
jgi:hypothetical protein